MPSEGLGILATRHVNRYSTTPDSRTGGAADSTRVFLPRWVYWWPWGEELNTRRTPTNNTAGSTSTGTSSSTCR
jgi:hypothetical protein